jgi:hypothetical protein
LILKVASAIAEETTYKNKHEKVQDVKGRGKVVFANRRTMYTDELVQR